MMALGASVAGAAPKAKPTTQCKVPALAKKTQAAAKKALKKANCAAGKVTTKSSQKIGKGKVISSNPKGGSKHPAGTKVKLVVSSGKGKTKTQCVVPKLAKKTEAAAKKALKKANCAAGKITNQSSQKIAKGKVISSNPKAGAKRKAGAKVALVVSSGKTSSKKQCIVPALAGNTETAASQALTKANCALGKVTQKSSNTVAKGKVISSSPKAGVKRKAGAKVNLVVSSGKTPPAQSCKVPNVVGQSQSAAESAITKANCTVGKVTQKSSNTVAKGNVISTSPTAGTSHKAGSKVNLVVSTGKKSTYPVPKP